MSESVPLAAPDGIATADDSTSATTSDGQKNLDPSRKPPHNHTRVSAGLRTPATAKATYAHPSSCLDPAASLTISSKVHDLFATA